MSDSLAELLQTPEVQIRMLRILLAVRWICSLFGEARYVLPVVLEIAIIFGVVDNRTYTYSIELEYWVNIYI